MKALFLPPAKTPLTVGVVREALRAGLARLASRERWNEVREHTVLGLLAQSALETGRWKSLWNYNFGNVKAGESYEGFFTCLPRVSEVLDGVEVFFTPQGRLEYDGGPIEGKVWDVPPGHPQTRFRAFETVDGGVDAWLTALTQNFPIALQSLRAGAGMTDYAAVLKRQRYYTGNEQAYAKAISSLYNEYSVSGPPPTTVYKVDLSAPAQAATDDDRATIPDGVIPKTGQVEWEEDRKRYVIPLFFSGQS